MKMKVKIFLLILATISGLALFIFSFTGKEVSNEPTLVFSVQPIPAPEPSPLADPSVSPTIGPEPLLAPPMVYSEPLKLSNEMVLMAPTPEQTGMTPKDIVELVNDILQKLIGLVMSAGGMVLMIIEIKKKRKELEEKKKVLV